MWTVKWEFVAQLYDRLGTTVKKHPLQNSVMLWLSNNHYIILSMLIGGTDDGLGTNNSRCVHGFRGPNARTLVAFTDSVNRMPGVVIASTDFVNSTPHESYEWSHSDAMKSHRGTCHAAPFMEVLLKIPPCTIQCFIQGTGTTGVPIKLFFQWIILFWLWTFRPNKSNFKCKFKAFSRPNNSKDQWKTVILKSCKFSTPTRGRPQALSHQYKILWTI
jgi:hypothetical protein